MKNKGFTLIEIIIVLAILAILAVITLPFTARLIGFDYEYSNGERTGVVIKISQRGFIWKTWEGEMNLGGMNTDGGGIVTPNVWCFSVKDVEVIKQIQSAASAARRITIVYREVLKASFREGDTDYFAISIRKEAKP